MSILEGLTDYYKTFGLGGVLRASSNRIFGAPKEFCVESARVRYPVHLRLRTSDISLFRAFLTDHGQEVPYGIQLPFTPRTIVDAGANIGMASVLYANTYPEAKIVAVEPEPSNYEMLVKNTAPYHNILPLQAALWDRDCDLHLGPTGLDSIEYGKWAYMVTDQGIPVRGITMQTLMRETEIDSIDLLKMDIEGGEIEAFANCTDWMRSIKALMIELHDHMRPGCKSVVDAACQGFRVTTDGAEMTYYVR
jgi:FkbM family methyltransferase